MCHGMDLVTIGKIIIISDSRIGQSVLHSPNKRGVPGSSPDMTAHFSQPVTLALQVRLIGMTHFISEGQRTVTKLS